MYGIGLQEAIVGVVLFMFFVLPWVLLAIAVGHYADRRGRSRAAWTTVALFISPLVGWALVAALPRLCDELEEERIPCPYCAEDIKLEAIVCPHCRRNVTEGETRFSRLVPRELARARGSAAARAARATGR